MRHILLMLACLFVPALARADVPPPGVSECSGRAVGDPCSYGDQNGACVASSCSRAVRLGPSEGTVESYPCVVCDTRATPTNHPEPDDGGCAIGGSRASWPAWIVLATALVLVRRRPR